MKLLFCNLLVLRYDRNKLTLKDIHSAQYISCMNPTAGSFTINPRLQVCHVLLAFFDPCKICKVFTEHFFFTFRDISACLRSTFPPLMRCKAYTRAYCLGISREDQVGLPDI